MRNQRQPRRRSRFGKSIFPQRNSRSLTRASRRRRLEKRELQLEALEPRQLLAIGPQLVAIETNHGALLFPGNEPVTLDVAPQQLTFVFDDGQTIDPATVQNGIEITRAGRDGVFGDANDRTVAPGWVGIGDNPNEVIFRFQETLPDDLFQVLLFGTGAQPLRNDTGDALNDLTDDGVDDGADEPPHTFRLDLGAQIIAVVPEPITRNAGTGALSQARDQIVVYFNDDDLEDTPQSAENPAFYQLIFTNDTATNTDDQVFLPTGVGTPGSPGYIKPVDYDPDADMAVLTFGDNLDNLHSGSGTYRLRIGTNEAIPLVPDQIQLRTNAATDMNTNGQVEITFTANTDVGAGDPITINFSTMNPGSAAPPILIVNTVDREITIFLNEFAGAPSTAQDVVNAINTHAVAPQLISAAITGGLSLADVTTNLPAIFEITIVDPGSAFSTAHDLGALTAQSIIISSEIESQYYGLTLPGSDDEPSHRPTSHVSRRPDQDPGIITIPYNFRELYGLDPQDKNLIAEPEREAERQLIRQMLETYQHYLGVQFFETEEDGVTIAIGELEVVDPLIWSGEGDWLGVAGVVDDPVLGLVPTIVLDAAELWNETFGHTDDLDRPSFFLEAMKQMGTLLGMNVIGIPPLPEEMPPITVMQDYPTTFFQPPIVDDFGNPVEPVFPGDQDLVHAEHLYRPEGKDIDLYQFELTTSGNLTIETIAERLPDSSLLDSVVTVYRQQGNEIQKIAQNDDYFSEDSFVELFLKDPGTYYVGVSSTGNTDYDPAIEDTGFGGTTEGKYDLRVTFRPEVVAQSIILDTTGTPIDGDADGDPRGVYNFWSRTEGDTRSTGHGQMIYVDKLAADGGNGSLTAPFNTISDAFAASQFLDIVRIVGNGGGDGDVWTLGDNLAFELGLDTSQIVPVPLPDGETMDVPAGVMVQIDAGAIFKMRSVSVTVGTQQVDATTPHNAATLQVFGTPRVFDQGGNVLLDGSGDPVVGSVLFTSYDDENNGVDNNPLPTLPTPGNWGGLVFQNDIDRDEGRFEWEQEGIFLNYVNHADLRFGGGFVGSSPPRENSPIHMTEARPTISYNTITQSRITAMSADPNSFKEDNFHSPAFQAAGQFTADYSRIGPEIHGNTVINNSQNALFVRTATPAGKDVQKLTVTARWDDRDIVHLVSENLVIAGTPGGPTGELKFVPGGIPDAEPGIEARVAPVDLVDIAAVESDYYTLTAREDASLVIDPGIIVKLGGARIEASLGTQLIAEGKPGQEIIATSAADDRFGAGGTFDTTNDGNASTPQPGDWAGLIFTHLSQGSIDQALITYGGGDARIEGEWVSFNTIEIHQADVRITRSLLENNADGHGDNGQSDRIGRGFNEPATIFIRGAQPVIVNNTIQNNEGPVISVNVNALNSDLVDDWGRSTGEIGLVVDSGGSQIGKDNQGPLVDGNLLSNNDINGMDIRAQILTTESVWDDTGIVHVLREEVIVPNHHAFGGLRLESSADGSLVVKLDGNQAGITATGEDYDIADRIGGRIHVAGQGANPVIFTSLADDMVGAGDDPNGRPLTDTNNDGDATTAAPGDWRSIRLEEFSHDRNVAVFTEQESPAVTPPGTNRVPARGEFLGLLAPFEKGGDDMQRLGFEIHGLISGPNDLDVYSFEATPGTEIFFDIDRTSQDLDTVIELVDRNGVVLARSDNSEAEAQGAEQLFATGGITVRPLAKSPLEITDLYTTNLRDAGMRAVLPGTQRDPITRELRDPVTWYVRVRSSTRELISDPADNGSNPLGGRTSGVYQLQIRLQEVDEFAGSGIEFAEIRYATNGIEVWGQPAHSPLAGEAIELEDAPNNAFTDAQFVGNPYDTDRFVISVNGSLDAEAATGLPAEHDIDWYRVALGGPIVIEMDYASGFGRPNTSLWLFDSAGRLVASATDSNVQDDLPGPISGADVSDLSGGSAKGNDPFLGPIDVPPGDYYIAVTPNWRTPTELANPGIKREPLDSIGRIVEDHIQQTPFDNNPPLGPPIPPPYSPWYVDLELGVSTYEQPQYAYYDPATFEWMPVLDEASEVPYHLGDVVLFVSTEGNDPNTSRIYTIDPFTGIEETYVGQFGREVADIAMHPDGTLRAFEVGTQAQNGPTDGNSDDYLQIDTTYDLGFLNVLGQTGIETYQQDPNNPQQSVRTNNGNGDGIQFQAMDFWRDGNNQLHLLAVGNRGMSNPPGVEDPRSVLYVLNTDDGAALSGPQQNRADGANEQIYNGAGTQIRERGALLTSPQIELLRDFNPADNNPAKTAVDVTRWLGRNNVPEFQNTDFTLYDGLTLTISDGVNRPVRFEIDMGADIRQDINTNNATTIRDGNFFILDPSLDTAGDERIFQLDTHEVIRVNRGGVDILDGQTITIVPVPTGGGNTNTVTFEFDKDTALVNSTATAIPIANNMNDAAVAGAIRTAINAADFGANGNVTAEQSRNRVTLTGDLNVSLGPGVLRPFGQPAIEIEGGTGEAPILRAVDGAQLADGDTFDLQTISNQGQATVFEFDSGYALNVPTDITTILDQQTFGIDIGTTGTPVTFEFNTDGSFPDVAGDFEIAFDPGTATQDDVGIAIADAIRNSSVTLTFDLPGFNPPQYFGNGIVWLGGTANDTVTNNSSLVVDDFGVTGNNVRVPFVPSATFTADQTAQSMSDAILAVSQKPAPIVVNANLLQDGLVYQVDDGGTTVYFELDEDAATVPTVGSTGGVPHIPVLYFPGTPGDPNATPPIVAVAGDSIDVVADRLANAIDLNTTTLDATSPGFGGVVQLELLDRSLALTATTQLVILDATTQIADAVLVVNGDQIQFNPRTSPLQQLQVVSQINVEEVTFNAQANVTAATIGSQVANAVNADGRFTASARFVRINFVDANAAESETGDFSGIPVWNDNPMGTGPSQGGVVPGRTPIQLFADDRAADRQVQQGNTTITIRGVAWEIEQAINSHPSLQAVNARSFNEFVRLELGTASVDYPMATQGGGLGGTITGIANAGGTFYAVSDQGGLYSISNPFSTPANAPTSAQAVFINSSADDLAGIEFVGLESGPPNVEGGRYAEILFGIDANGRLYAFDTTGVLQPVFFDGQTNIDTSLTGFFGFGDTPDGLAFSTLDTNLWQILPESGGDQDLGRQRLDDSHHLESPVTESRDELYYGGSTYHFGNMKNGTYDYPGGAHGSLVSNEFSLVGYAAEDQPHLYVTYFLDEGGDNDVFRVFGTDNSGDWVLLAEPGNTGGQWRQVRVSMAAFAGKDNVRLRFDFSTAGEMNLGDIETVGEELRAISGAELIDGQTFRIMSEQFAFATPFATADEEWVFELDLGYSVVLPTAPAIVDGETLTIGDAAGNVVTYEFDHDGSAGTGYIVPDGSQITDGETIIVEDNGTPALTLEFDSGYNIQVPVAGGTAGGVVDEDTFDIVDIFGTATTYEFDGDMTPFENGGDVSLEFDPATSTQDDIADLIATGVRTTIGSQFLADEPNDTMADAIPTGIVVGKPGIFQGDGTIDHGLDVDMIELPLVAGDRVIVDVTAWQVGSALDAVLRMFDSNGDEVDFSDDLIGLDPLLDFTASQSDTYYVGISGSLNTTYNPAVEDSGDAGSTGDYNVEIRLNLAQGAGQQTINTTLLAVESNDTLAGATASGISFGNPTTYHATGLIGDNLFVAPNLDVDMISVPMLAADKITVTVDARALAIPSTLDSYLRVFNSAGTVVDFDDDGGFSVDSFLEFTAPVSDTYFIGVSGWSNTSYNPFVQGSGFGGSSGDYEITIQFEPAVVRASAATGFAVNLGDGIVHFNGWLQNLATAGGSATLTQFGVAGTTTGLPITYAPTDFTTGAELATQIAQQINDNLSPNVMAVATGPRVGLSSGDTIDVGTTALFQQDNIAVPLLPGLSGAEVADLLRQTIQANGPGLLSPVMKPLDEIEGPDGTTHPENHVTTEIAGELDDNGFLVLESVNLTNELNLVGAASVTQARAFGETTLAVQLRGDNGVSPGNIRVPIRADMTREEVAAAVDAVLEFTLTDQVLIVGDGSQFSDGDTFDLNDGLNNVTFEFDTGYVLTLPTAGGNAAAGGIADGDNFTVTDGTDTLVFEFNSDQIFNDLLSVDDTAGISENDTFQINDGANPTVFFEFEDTNNGVAAPLTTGAVQVLYDSTAVTPDSMATAIAGAITLAVTNLRLDPALVATTTGIAADRVHLSGVPVTLNTAATTGLSEVTNWEVIISTSSLPLDVGEAIEIALGNTPMATRTNLGLDNAQVVSNDRVWLSGTVDTTVDIASASAGFGVIGQPGPSDPTHAVVSFGPGSFFTATDMASAIVTSINSDPNAVTLGATASNTLGGQPSRRILLQGTPIALVNQSLTPGAELRLQTHADVIKTHGDLIRIIGHDILDKGPFGFDGQQPTFQPPWGYDGRFNFDLEGDKRNGLSDDFIDLFDPPGPGAVRGKSNKHEGLYIDDILIGFVERGELVISATPNTDFIPVPSPPPVVNNGGYQFEIRRSEPYMTRDAIYPLEVTFDTNDRFTDSVVLVVPNGADVVDGQQLVIGDGTTEVIFTYRDHTPVYIRAGHDAIADAFESGIVEGVETTFRANGVIEEYGGLLGIPFYEADLIRVDLQQGDRFTIDVDSAELGVLHDMAIWLFDPAGNLLLDNDDAPAPAEILTSDPYLALDAPYTGPYYVAISSAFNTALDPNLPITGSLEASYPYELEMLVGETGGLSDTDIAFDASDVDWEIAVRIRERINSDKTQEILNVQAATWDGSELGQDPTTAGRLNLFGPNVRVGRLHKELLIETNDTFATALDTGLVSGTGAEYIATAFLGDNPVLAERHELDVDMLQVELAFGDSLVADVTTPTGSVLDPEMSIFAVNDLGNTDPADDVIVLMDWNNNEVDPVTGLLLSTDPLIEFEFDATQLFGWEIDPPASRVFYVAVAANDNHPVQIDPDGYDPTIAGSGQFTSAISAGAYDITLQLNGGSIPFQVFDEVGDSNRFRDQGQIILHGNKITNSEEFGISADAGRRAASDGNSPHAGPVRVTAKVNVGNLVTGVTITNNVIANNTQGAINFSGDANAAGDPTAAIPFGRIINNTLVGTGTQDVGVLVGVNASPTLLNNIVSSFATGIEIDTASATTVVGGTLFEGNTANVADQNAVVLPLGQDAINLDVETNTALFVNQAAGNYYLADGGLALDSAVDSVQERFELNTIKAPLGIPPSPVKAPIKDQTGLLRTGGINLGTVGGTGEGILKDRGALERIDSDGPIVVLLTPTDNDSNIPPIDRDPREGFLDIGNVILSQFELQFIDATDTVQGIGIDDTTVTDAAITITHDGVQLPLTDYRFEYDATNNVVSLNPQTGIWLPGEYVISINNQVPGGVTDLAGNPLKPNLDTGETQFTILVGGELDWGDAPDTPYPTLSDNNGPSHVIVDGFRLGPNITPEGDGLQSPTAVGDADDGVTFVTTLHPGYDATIEVNVTNLAIFTDAYVDAWFDFDLSGSWEDTPAEHVLNSELVVAGSNSFTFSVPSGLLVEGDQIFARFRLSSTGGLQPTGPHDDGEVEDYLITVGTANPWHNPTTATSDPTTGHNADVNATGIITSQDLTILYSFIYFNGPQTSLPTPGNPNSAPFPTDGPPPYYDVNGDNSVDILDLRDLVALLPAVNPEGPGSSPTRARSVDPAPEGEGGSSSSLVGVGLTPETSQSDEPATAAVQIATMGAELAAPVDEQEPLALALASQDDEAAVDQLFAAQTSSQQTSSSSADAIAPLTEDQGLLLLAQADGDASTLDDALIDIAEADTAAKLSDDDLGNLLGELFSE